MAYVIFCESLERYVCRRRNVSYDLFTDWLHKARVYRTFKGAQTFANTINRVRGLDCFVMRLPCYDRLKIVRKSNNLKKKLL